MSTVWLCGYVQCFTFAEKYEDDIEEWYYHLQDQEDLVKYLCADRYLKDKDRSMSAFTKLSSRQRALTVVAFKQG